MAEVITLSSDSESESEVEIVGCYSNKNDLLPLSSVRVEVNALNIPKPVPSFDLTSGRSAHSKLNTLSTLDPTPSAVVDLTEDNNHFWWDSNITLKHCLKEAIADSQKQCTKDDLKSEEKSPRNSSNNPETIKIKQDHNNAGVYPDLSDTTALNCQNPFIEDPREQFCQGETNGSHVEPHLHYSQPDHFQLKHQISLQTFTQNSSELSDIPSPACASSSGKTQSLFSKDSCTISPSLPVGTLTVEPPLSASRNSSPADSTALCEDVDSLLPKNSKCDSLKMIELSEPLNDEVKSVKSSKSCCQMTDSSPSVCRTIILDEEPFLYEDDLGVNSPVSFSWGESGEEEENFELYSTPATQSEKYYVYPDFLKNLRGTDILNDDEGGSRQAQMLCRQSLSLVYSTIDENYQEGTLQLLSDLLKPNYYPPKDITSHLLRGILLNPHSPHHICVQAFDLLMRTQRYHIADKLSAPWDWETLVNVMEKQEHQPEIVRMFLEYVVKTLEDDFRTKQSTSAIYQSLAKAMLSFDRQFSHIRDVCKWLFSAIVKSTDCNEIEGEHVRIVAIFQRILSLSLEVDCSPAICSAKLSQELFHMLISVVLQRPQRMLLLESLQSKLLRCKLLEHLLDYSCPAKTSVPMSLSLLLHFLKNCTLSPDPKDGTENWRKWEELISLLWMLLLSYNNAMKGYLCGSLTERRDQVRLSVYKPEDIVSKCAVHEAVEAFLSRSKDDVGEALPLHVEESLTYLQDHLLDVCQT